MATVNNRLSVVKVYARLALKAGTIDPNAYQLIKAVSSYSGKEAKRIDERRETTRVGDKKEEHVSLAPDEARRLKQHDATPQGRRDRLLSTTGVKGLLRTFGMLLANVLVSYLKEGRYT